MTRHENRSDAVLDIGRQLEVAARQRRRTARAVGIAAVTLVALGTGLLALALTRPDASEARSAADVASVPVSASSTKAAEPVSEAAAEVTPAPDPAPEPASTPAAPAPKKTAAPAAAPAAQRLSVAIGDTGYEPASVTAKAGVPISLTVGKGEGCAAGFLLPALGISADNSAGPVTVSLPALEPGSYQFSCGMEMVFGEIRVE